jgi:hypothetical protein
MQVLFGEKQDSIQDQLILGVLSIIAIVEITVIIFLKREKARLPDGEMKPTVRASLEAAGQSGLRRQALPFAAEH